MKQLSIGTLIVYQDLILLGHSTNNKHWDILKGKQEYGETKIQTALRELKEESGLELDADSLCEIGFFSYTKTKNLFLFKHEANIKYDTNLMCCQTLVDDVFPEIDNYIWVKREHVGLFCTPNLTKVIAQVA